MGIKWRYFEDDQLRSWIIVQIIFMKQSRLDPVSYLILAYLSVQFRSEGIVFPLQYKKIREPHILNLYISLFK